MRLIKSLETIVDQFDVAVLDQWGVMHDGTAPYPDAVAAMKMLANHGKEIVVVSNSGKRAAVNLQRIARIGLPKQTIHQVVTSGETLWEDCASGSLSIDGKTIRKLFPISASFSDAVDWADNHAKIELTDELDATVDAIMLMGLPDGSTLDDFNDLLHRGIQLKRPLVCSNPDKTSPRAGGLVISPGALADTYEKDGGTVIWYGKPHANIYRAVMRRFPDLPPERFLMVGDSLEHDIAGAQNLGLRSAFVRGGIHADEFGHTRDPDTIREVCFRLSDHANVTPPDFVLEFLS